jgi:hypothetical protein
MSSRSIAPSCTTPAVSFSPPVAHGGQQALLELGSVAAGNIEPEGFDPQLQFHRLALEDFAFATGRPEVFPHVGQRLLGFSESIAELFVIPEGFLKVRLRLLEVHFQLAVFNI